MHLDDQVEHHREEEPISNRDECLGCEEIKPISESQRSRKTVERDGNGGSGGGASIANEALFPR